MFGTKRIAAVILALLLWPALADAIMTMPPMTYTKTTPDEKYLFVMIAPHTMEEEASFWIEAKAAEIRAIRETYPESGLYRNDGSSTPLWTVDWYAGDVILLSDGVHMVRESVWVRSPDEPIVSFFANGELLKSYTVSDVVPFPETLEPGQWGHLSWWDSPPEYLADARQYEIQAKQDGYYLFDVTTGEIIEERHPTVDARRRMVLAGAMGGLLLLAALVFTVWWVRSEDRRGGGDRGLNDA